MKNLVLVFLGLICFSNLSAQVQTIRANVDRTSTVEMTVRIENGIAYVHRASVPFDAASKHGIQDLADVEIGDGTITFPDNEESYWIVPFNQQIAAFSINLDHLCFRCNCLENGKCETVRRECYFGSCDACMLSLISCNDAKNPIKREILRGPFTIVRAKQLLME